MFCKNHSFTRFSRPVRFIGMIFGSSVKNYNMKTKISLGLVGLLFLFMNACTKDSNSTSQQGTTDMEVSLTDAPGNYDEVNIDLQGVEVITESEGTRTLD